MYFKGVIYRLHVQSRHIGDDRAVMRYNSMSKGLRSFESVAAQEAVIEKRRHAKHLAWCRSTQNVGDAVQPERTETTIDGEDLYNDCSDTLTLWLESSTKEELSFLKNRDKKDYAMDELRQEGIFDLREYIRGHRSRKASPKKAVATGSHVSASGAVKKPNAQREVFEPRRQAHKSLKAPQAALREREELRRWYDSKKALAWHDELRKRGIRPVPGRKVDMVQLLVEDDKRVVKM
jgi:hypothetical protein